MTISENELEGQLPQETAKKCFLSEESNSTDFDGIDLNERNLENIIIENK